AQTSTMWLGVTEAARHRTDDEGGDQTERGALTPTNHTLNRTLVSGAGKLHAQTGMVFSRLPLAAPGRTATMQIFVRQMSRLAKTDLDRLGPTGPTWRPGLKMLRAKPSPPGA